MYKAIQEIGGYKIGDEVPVEKALVWQKMYVTSPVKKVGAEPSANADSVDAPKDKANDAPEVDNAMHDDYLNRNGDVVNNAIKDDKLKKSVLESLLKIESSNKKRKPVIEAIQNKLKTLN